MGKLVEMGRNFRRSEWGNSSVEKAQRQQWWVAGSKGKSVNGAAAGSVNGAVAAGSVAGAGDLNKLVGGEIWAKGGAAGRSQIRRRDGEGTQLGREMKQARVWLGEQLCWLGFNFDVYISDVDFFFQTHLSSPHSGRDKLHPLWAGEQLCTL
ncbi:hypothetical protein Adt_30506 [Abeliophyllum distichum]|uniref:Uncharacterized protein n=1 Tax=Abeliophyllum distichum TaxID=126358 RepID=A0ABD1RBI1_9LAMI